MAEKKKTDPAQSSLHSLPSPPAPGSSAEQSVSPAHFIPYRGPYFKNLSNKRVGEMAQQLRTLAALAEGLHSILRTHIQLLTAPCNSSKSASAGSPTQVAFSHRDT